MFKLWKISQHESDFSAIKYNLRQAHSSKLVQVSLCLFYMILLIGQCVAEFTQRWS